VNVKKIEKALADVVTRMVLRGFPPHTVSGSRGGGSTVYHVTEKELGAALLESIDYFDLGRAVVEALLTEEATDELLEGIQARVKLPWYIPGRIVWGMLDKKLPEAIRGPLLDQLDKLERAGDSGAALGR